MRDSLRRGPCRFVRVLGAWALLLLAIGSGAVASSAARAAPPVPGITFAITPIFPANVIVGQTAVPASVLLESFSGTVTEVTLTPACPVPPSPTGCSPSGTLGLSATATGSGPACAGVAFGVVGPDAFDGYRLVPSAPLVFTPPAAGVPASCTISFTFDVVRSAPGPVVHQVANIVGYFGLPLVSHADLAPSYMSVSRATPLMTATVGPTTAALGATIETTATLGAGDVGPRTPPPSGTVRFKLFGPGGDSCAGSPASTSAPIAVGNLDPVASFVPRVPGTYHSVATYSGDGNYAPVPSGCSETGALITAATAPPTPVPSEGPASTTPVAGPPSRPSPAPPAPPETRAPASPDRAPTDGTLAPYDPIAHPREVAELAISAFALLTLLGAAGGDSRSGSGSGSPKKGSVVSAKTTAVAKGAMAAAVDLGDRSRTWRWPATSRLDRLSRELPPRIALASPLLARVVNDGGYLRAMFGSGSMVLPVLGVVLGIAAVIDTGGQALPPMFALAMAIAVLSVLDAMAGFVAVVVFACGVVVAGGLSSATALRTLLGLATLWFAAPLIAGSQRPLRRPPTSTMADHWIRIADVVIASLVGAWAVQKILQGLPGLAGLDLPIAKQANMAALVVLAALGARMALETAAAHWYPVRLAQAQEPKLPAPGLGQQLGASAIALAIFVFVAVSYIGSCWQLYVGAGLFIVPSVLKLYQHSFPNSPRLHAVLPRGVVKIVVMLFVGAIAAAIVQANFDDNRDLVRYSFVLLSIPGLVLSLLGLVGRDGAKREPGWVDQLLGTFVLLVGVLLVLGVIAV